jgi:hypothetical protein
MNMETGISRNQIIAELSKSPHGKLEEYIPVGKRAAAEQGEFLAHLIAWDRIKGQVRDAKVALPLVSLMVPKRTEEFVENALAALTLLNPREMLKALHFALDVRDVHKGTLPMARISHALSVSLLERERNWPKWERVMLQHRAVIRDLFALLHIGRRDQRTSACLWQCDKVDGKRVRLPYPEGGLFEIVSRLKDMSPQEAAGTIINKKIPFLIAQGALGEKAKDADLVLALIKSMTATELVTNTKMLEGLGIKTNPVLRGAFQEALSKAGSSTANVLKTTRAAENIDDEELKENLRGLQEKQIQKLGGVEGDWLVLGDRSPSMQHSVEVAKEVAATLTALVKGKVWLTFFDSHPQTIDVTGASLDIIKKATKHITAGGSGTSIGCGLQRMLEAKTIVDGIAIVSDAEENSSPMFPDVYRKYSEFVSKEVPVYLYLTNGGSPRLIDTMQQAGHDMQVFDLRNTKSDFYSLPNLVNTMRTQRYSLVDEIMDTKLLTLSDAYKTSPKKKAAAF